MRNGLVGPVWRRLCCWGSRLALLAALLVPVAAWARAGGGGGFSGGGGGFSGGGGGFSGGGGSSGGGELALLIWLVVDHPLVGVPVLIVVGVLFYRNGRATLRAHMGRTIRKGYAALAPQRNVAA